MGIGRDIASLLASPSRLRAVAAQALLQRVVHCKGWWQRFDGREEACGRQAWACPVKSESGGGRGQRKDQDGGPPEHRTAANAPAYVLWALVSC